MPDNFSSNISATGDGTLFDPYLHGIHDSVGDLIDGTINDDNGITRNSRWRWLAYRNPHPVGAGSSLIRIPCPGRWSTA